MRDRPSCLSIVCWAAFTEDFAVVSGFFERRYARLLQEFEQIRETAPEVRGSTSTSVNSFNLDTMALLHASPALPPAGSSAADGPPPSPTASISGRSARTKTMIARRSSALLMRADSTGNGMGTPPIPSTEAGAVDGVDKQPNGDFFVEDLSLGAASRRVCACLGVCVSFCSAPCRLVDLHCRYSALVWSSRTLCGVSRAAAGIGTSADPRWS
jgi:hypothetical protein